MRPGRIVRALALGGVALAACRRPAPEPRRELTGAWLREPERSHGFELREDGALALLGPSDRYGLAWNVSRGELELSTDTESRPEPDTQKLEIAALEPERLVLVGESPLAGTYGRASVAHLRGIATYRERTALPPGARVELRVARGADAVATSVFAVRAPVPIPFDVSFLPAAAGPPYTLSVAIREGGRTLFSTPEPLSVRPDGEPLEVLLRAVPP